MDKPFSPRGRAFRIILMVLVLLLVSGLTVPAVLVVTGVWSDAALARLGNLGQAYGTVSVLLSVIALVGVTGSVAYQADQNRVQRIQGWRSMHTELLKMAIDEPDAFGPCIGGYDHTRQMQYRQLLFSTLWFNYLRSGFELGQILESNLRAEGLSMLFATEQGRRHWEIARQYPRQPRWRRFGDIAEDEYQKAKLRLTTDEASP